MKLSTVSIAVALGIASAAPTATLEERISSVQGLDISDYQKYIYTSTPCPCGCRRYSRRVQKRRPLRYYQGQALTPRPVIIIQLSSYSLSPDNC
jgi:hypothetical protein